MITVAGVEYSAEDIAAKLTELASVKSQLAEYQSKFEALQKEVHAEKLKNYSLLIKIAYLLSLLRNLKLKLMALHCLNLKH